MFIKFKFGYYFYLAFDENIFLGYWSKHWNKGERRIIHICRQCLFEDQQLKFERADVWLILKVWSSQTSRRSTIGHSYCHSYSAEVWMSQCKSSSGCLGTNEYVRFSDPQTKSSNDLFKSVDITHGPLLATTPPYPTLDRVPSLQ